MSGFPITLAVLTTASTFAAGAQVQVTSLPKAERSISHPFDRIRGLHELRDGRIVVLDANAQSVLLVDFAADAVTQIGRIGSGPREYRLPTGLLRLGGDSIGIIDGGNRRILVITGNGTPSGFLDAHGGKSTNQSRPTGQGPTASDGRGNLYTLAFSNFTPEHLQPTDSAPIERWRVGATRRDTVAYLPLRPVRERTLPPGEGSRAFTTAPQWALGLDGQIAIVRPNPYSVEQIDARGTHTKGRPIQYRRLRVSAAQKKQWYHDETRPHPVMMMIPGNVAPRADVRVSRPFEPVQWPAFLPPFLSGAPRFDPNGLLWIRRTTEVGAPEHFDIVDSRGIVVQQVHTPPRTQLVGSSRSYVYLITLDEDHQEFLGRYPWPTMPRPR